MVGGVLGGGGSSDVVLLLTRRVRHPETCRAPCCFLVPRCCREPEHAQARASRCLLAFFMHLEPGTSKDVEVTTWPRCASLLCPFQGSHGEPKPLATDPGIDAVMFAKGGLGASRDILNHLDIGVSSLVLFSAEQ